MRVLDLFGCVKLSGSSLYTKDASYYRTLIFCSASFSGADTQSELTEIRHLHPCPVITPTLRPPIIQPCSSSGNDLPLCIDA